MTPEARPIKCTSGRARSYGKNKVYKHFSLAYAVIKGTFQWIEYHRNVTPECSLNILKQVVTFKKTIDWTSSLNISVKKFHEWNNVSVLTFWEHY